MDSSQGSGAVRTAGAVYGLTERRNRYERMEGLGEAMNNREGWERGEGGPKTIKGKTYRSLVEFRRPCAVCMRPFSIYVTEKIAAGHSDTNSFKLRTCEAHRKNATNGELEELRNTIASLRQEVDPLYVEVKKLFDENQQLKARLAKYELSETTFEQAVAAFKQDPSLTIGCEPVQNISPSASTRFPWQS